MSLMKDWIYQFVIYIISTKNYWWNPETEEFVATLKEPTLLLYNKIEAAPYATYSDFLSYFRNEYNWLSST
jgi:hypothetical protein